MWNILCLILCLWFRISLIYINNFPTKCNTKQSIYYSSSYIYIFRVSATSIIRSTQNSNSSLRYWSYFLCSYLHSKWPSWPRWREVAVVTGGCSYREVAVVTVLCTPDDECVWHPKYVEWICRIINTLLCLVSLWTFIYTLLWLVLQTELISVPGIKRVSFLYFIKHDLKSLGFLWKRDDTRFPTYVAV